MQALYYVCALVGGVLFVIQFLLGLVGHGGPHDIDGHIDAHTGGDVGHETNLFTGILSFRAMVAGLTVFGLVGLITLSESMPGSLGLAIAAAAAFCTALIVAAIMRSMTHLASEGTIRIENAVGRPGTVYLGIPAGRAGLGKVTLTLQERTVEYQAMTAGAALSIGTKVNVTKIIGADTVEVVPATTQETVV
eukprot:TRINITY_DN15611_c0_g1_i2.p2 TRINITY_DN15611_c0_g1~~TRINITY_DN15611_c0_g1_i2.p2  ORF type:complete len:192 (-),score=28.99 TRINITY_DN15611_c0_g1_i2:54-629(-)